MVCCLSHLRGLIADLELDGKKGCNSVVFTVDPRENSAIASEKHSYGIHVRHEGEVGTGSKVRLLGQRSSFLLRSAHKGVEVFIKSVITRERTPELEYLAWNVAAFQTLKFRGLLEDEEVLYYACGEGCFVHSRGKAFISVC